MSDIDYSALEDAVITLESEDGESTECRLICIFEYNDQDYAAFEEMGNDEHEVYFFALNAKKKKKKTEFEFNMIDEDELLDQLLEVLQQLTDAAFEEDGDNVIIDEGEDEDDFPDEDDSKWDQFINKKLD